MGVMVWIHLIGGWTQILIPPPPQKKMMGAGFKNIVYCQAQLLFHLDNVGQDKILSY
jgi:hypothetical protein